MTINELREARNKAWEGAKAFVESKRDKDGLLSAEDAATYADMEKKIKDYGAEIERMEQMEALENELKKPVNTPIVTKPMTTDTKPEKKGRASDEYKTGMLIALRTNFKQISNVLQEGVDADGGYLVPEEYDHRLIQALAQILCVSFPPVSPLPVSIRSTSQPPSLPRHGLKRAVHCLSVMLPSTKSFWMPISSM